MKYLNTLLTLIFSCSLLFACSKQELPSSGTQKVISDPITLSFPDIYDDYLNRDVRDDIFYFVMPDRFYNGNPDNDMGSKSIPISQGGYSIDDIKGFHGGDIKGLEQKLDYLKELGISAIWMTPILRNKAIQSDGYAHHGYWILDFTQIDPHFGSNQDLKDLISAAHDKGIKIFFDIITNHTADVISYQECHNSDGSFIDERTCPYKSKTQLESGDKYTAFVPAGNENVKVPAWLNDPKYYNNQGDSIWQGESAINGDFAGLDDLNTKDPQVIAGMIEIYKNIISEFKPDGFRIDTVKHVDMVFWSSFSPAILNHAKQQGIPNFHIFGEVYSADPIELSSYTTLGKMPSVLDFGFQDATANVFYRNKPAQEIYQLFENDDFYNDNDSQSDLLMNFLGNHDMGRAGFFINQSLPNASAEEKLKRDILSHAFMYLSRGIPVVYYGDEQGFVGTGGDVGAREDMFASKVAAYNELDLLGTEATTATENFDQNHPIYRALQKLAQLRMDHPTLRRGFAFNRASEGSEYAFAISRVDKQDSTEYLLAFNPTNQPQTIRLKASSDGYQWIDGSRKFSMDSNDILITLPALSYTVLKANSAIENTELVELEFLGTESQGRVIRFDYRLAEQVSSPLPLFEVTTEISNQQGEYELVAKDNTPPYSAIIDKQKFIRLAAKDIRVSISDWQGKSVVHTFSLEKNTDVERTINHIN
ncbi:alpha-amylase family glycosyl hydrolase [Aliiglaciecola sp. 2_MG-2023]|uniref:alpha-amylase family glycosyl hydrolase n=1 Tax=unclassified Aliiglaciecola TaxID=2593648 RepID=UPI0026E31806|nr:MULTISPECIES: alpha-amylase family glycosyl hydrolase [unclassified Aliiglaciecola]MDO6712556.1 alpha-amylase family glycosyl hydrolase [Aliiglaciecola sp. 2_MG-2023]MDO6753700.1 alpha-amylase family glycosyl hydrolase [Aliiglaciecola sp. 1_MG-2023]